MSDSVKKHIPRWAQRNADDYESLALMPNSGIQPEFRPKLVTRLLPANGGNRISAKTLVDTANITQRVLQYVSHDLVHGPNSAFTDLRTIGKEILSLSNLTIEPFEEGSFVIPALLPEEEVQVNGQTFSGSNVLERFCEVFNALSKDNGWTTRVSMGLIQSINELGRIVRREANIEYTTSYQKHAPFIVDDKFIDRVSKVKAGLIDHDVMPDRLSGRLTALDITKSRLVLTLDDKTAVKGSFELLMQPTLIDCLNDFVQVWGVIERTGGVPTFIRVFTVERFEQQKNEPATESTVS